MNTSARLTAARWCCLGAQARLDRLSAFMCGNHTAASAYAVWMEICDMRREFWAGESTTRLTPAPQS